MIVDRFAQFCTKYNLPKFRYQQIVHAMFTELVGSFEEITALPANIRQQLSAEVAFNTLDETYRVESERKDTIKVVLKRKLDGQQIEAVLMRHEDGRNTVCVSCMIGCPVNCSFCATGKMGYGGSLNGEEITDQVLHFGRLLKNNYGPEHKVTNVVYMGMGEPMLNLPAIKQSVTDLTEKLGISKRKITVSTSGYIPQLKDFIDWGFRGKIAVSLHAPNQELRAKLMPVAKLYTLDKLMPALFEFEKLTNKRISYEYVMIQNVNDTEECARELGRLLQGHLAHVNLIPYNPISQENFERSSKNRIHNFRDILNEYKVENTVRVTMGDDVDAACGQLIDRANKAHVGKSIK